MRGIASVLSRRWWWVFTLFIAMPGVVLALLGWKAIRVDELERRERQREQFKQYARVADVALANGIERLSSVAEADSDHERLAFERDANDVIAFPSSKVFVGAFGAVPSFLSEPDDRLARTAIIAAGYATVADSSTADKVAPAMQQTLQQLRSGRWWLSLDQRRAYDQALRESLAKGTRPGSLAVDDQLSGLGEAADLIRSALGSASASSGVSFVNGRLVAWRARSDSAGLAGVVLSGRQLTAFFDATVGRLSTGNVVAELRDPQGQKTWGRLPSGVDAHVESLDAIAGWRIAVADSAATGTQTTRRLSQYALVLLPVLMLAAGLAMTAWIVRREMALTALQSQFVSSVTHEFKSPLTSIRLLMERLSGGRDLPPDSIERYYTAVTAEADRLESLVNRLLESQKLQGGKREYVRRPTSLVTVAGATVDRMRAQAEAKSIQLRLESAPQVPDLAVDRESIADAISNLIDNAIKYSPAKTQVSVAVRAENGAVRLDVSDEGIGVNPAEARRIFEPFYRSRRGDQENVHGTGLGLSLVKAAAEAHGGSVEVSANGARGSRFTMRLPIQQERS